MPCQRMGTNYPSLYDQGSALEKAMHSALVDTHALGDALLNSLLGYEAETKRCRQSCGDLITMRPSILCHEDDRH